MISTYWIAGDLQHLNYTRKSAVDPCRMYLVTHQINEAILGLLSEEIMQKYLYQKTILRLLNVKRFPSLLFLCQCLVIVAKFCTLSKFEQIN